LTRRTYQHGYIFQKGRRKKDAWQPNEPAYVQFYRDVPGEADVKHEAISLGVCRTRSIAERQAAEQLEKLGINSTQTFIESTSTITFRQQAEIWLKSLASRKRNPLEQTTIDTRRYALHKWMYPFFEGCLLADVNNRAMKEFVEHIQPYLKTQNSERDIDLSTSLAKMLREYIGERTSGLLFCTSTGAQLLQANTLQDSLHPILKNLEHVKGGFNIFRRFRITHLNKSDCPDALKHFWSGHAHTHVSERYTKLLQDREFRLDWAEKVGLGFELPARSISQPSKLLKFRRVC